MKIKSNSIKQHIQLSLERWKTLLDDWYETRYIPSSISKGKRCGHKWKNYQMTSDKIMCNKLRKFFFSDFLITLKCPLTAKVVWQKLKFAHTPAHKTYTWRQTVTNTNFEAIFWYLYDLNCQLTNFEVFAAWKELVSRALVHASVLWSSERF